MEAPVTNSTSAPWRPARGGPVTLAVPVTDLSMVGEARRAADGIARSCGLDEPTRSDLGILVTEAATNLARHATEGVLYLNDTQTSGVPGVELIAVDSGPGMRDVADSLRDGVSTGGTPGTGLGAISRIANEMHVYSRREEGTVVLARLHGKGDAANAGRGQLLDAGVICRPMTDGQPNGDGWLMHQAPDRALVLVVDGLGHGPVAAESADVARESFRGLAAATPLQALGALHESMRSTRGGALAVAEIVLRDGALRVTLAGAGNISASVVGTTGARSLPSMNGTAGLQIRAMQEFSVEWPQGAMLIMHSDGINTRWRLDNYPGLLMRPPSVVAAVIHRDFLRGRDDATVLVLAQRS